MGGCCTRTLDANTYISQIPHVDTRIQPVLEITDELRDEIIKTMVQSYSGSKKTQPEHFYNWIFGPQHSNLESEDRKQLYQWHMSYILEITKRRGILYITRDQSTKDISGVACIFPPGQIKNGNKVPCCTSIATEWTVGKPLEVQNKKKLSGEQIVKRREFLESFMEQNHKKYAGGDHWYLALLAVNPQFQGQGLGHSLLKLFTALADNDSLGAYLECCGEWDRKLYAREGFVVKDSIKLELDGYKSDHQLYCMHKEPGQNVNLIRSTVRNNENNNIKNNSQINTNNNLSSNTLLDPKQSNIYGQRDVEKSFCEPYSSVMQSAQKIPSQSQL